MTRGVSDNVTLSVLRIGALRLGRLESQADRAVV